jgi:hypothetical protein
MTKNLKIYINQNININKVGFIVGWYISDSDTYIVSDIVNNEVNKKLIKILARNN